MVGMAGRYWWRQGMRVVQWRAHLVLNFVRWKWTGQVDRPWGSVLSICFFVLFGPVESVRRIALNAHAEFLRARGVLRTH